MWFVIIACIIIVICAFCGYLNKKNRLSSFEDKKTIWNERAIENRLDTIFVVLPCIDLKEGKNMIQALYQRAFIPQRVYIGLLTAKNEMLDLSGLEPFDKQIRQGTSQFSLGASVARNTIVNELYLNETYILITHAHMIPLFYWDKILLDSIGSVYSQGGHLVSQHPGNVETTQLKENIPPTFNVLENQFNMIPLFQPRFFVHGGYTYESMAVSAKCLFGKADLMKNKLKLFDFAIPLLTPLEDDFILTTLCFLQGAKFFTPIWSAFLHITNTERIHSYTAIESKALRTYSTNVITALSSKTPVVFETGHYPIILEYLQQFNKDLSLHYLDWIGFDPVKKVLTGKSLLGIIPSHIALSDQEIIHKFGSREIFDKFKHQFCLN